MKQLFLKGFKVGYTTIKGEKPNNALNVAVVVVLILLAIA